LKFFLFSKCCEKKEIFFTGANFGGTLAHLNVTHSIDGPCL